MMLQKIKHKIIKRQHREREVEMQLPWWWIIKLIMRVLGVVFITAAICWTYGQAHMCHEMGGYIPQEENTPAFISLHCEKLPEDYRQTPSYSDVNISINESLVYK